MNLGSLFSGLGMPPPNYPQPNTGSSYNNYNNVLIILIVILIIFGFGRTNLGFGGYGFFNYGRPPGIYKKHRKHHKHHKHHKGCGCDKCQKSYAPCCPPAPGIAGLDFILVIIFGAILLMQLKPKCNVC